MFALSYKSHPRRTHSLTSQCGDRDFLVSADCYNEDDDGLKVVSCADDEKVFLQKNECQCFPTEGSIITVSEIESKVLQESHR